MPPVPAVDGPLQLDVAYPAEGATVAARDSNFIFGSTGSGRASLTINGAPVRVAPNGGWLAFLPVPQDSVYRLQATKDGAAATFERRIQLPPPPPQVPLVASIVPGTVTPGGAWSVRAGENVEVSFTGTSGGQAWLVLPWKQRLPLVESRLFTTATSNAADFQLNVAGGVQPPSGLSRYSGIFPAAALRSRDTAVAVPRVGELPMETARDTMMERCAAAAAAGALAQAPRCSRIAREALEAYTRARGEAFVELVVGTDTVRAPLALNVAVVDLPRVGVAVDRSEGVSFPDWRIRGRNNTAGPFHYFWPRGTRMTITGQRGNFYRVQLAGDLTAWVPVSDVDLLPVGMPPPGGPIGSARFAPEPGYIDLRITLPERLPYHVEESERGLQIDVFGGVSQVNFFQYGQLDPLIERAAWSQPRDSVFRVDVQLAQPVWGYDAFHDNSGALVVRIRRPPSIDDDRPLRGVLIAVDAGHGGEENGALGPLHLREADANLAIALRLQPLLEAAGARVLMTRATDVVVGLAERTRLATEANAHILVSIHNNAFPDGVNPFENNGTSTYYYHPHSVDLAQAFQRELLAELGLRDIGYGRADLALVRPTWMPAALTETSFMMIPEQEAALRNSEWQERIARAHLRAIESFLRRRAAAQ